MRELSMHVLDLLQNAIEAGASAVSLRIREDTAADVMVISVADDGAGMPREAARDVVDPFFTTRRTRRVGLGIPLLVAAAERCNGKVTIDSDMGKGTTVTATFQLSHIDRAPLGDMAGTILSVALHEPPIDLQYLHEVDGREFRFGTAEMAAELGGLPLSHPEVVRWLRGYLVEGITELYGGGADA